MIMFFCINYSANVLIISSEPKKKGDFIKQKGDSLKNWILII